LSCCLPVCCLLCCCLLIPGCGDSATPPVETTVPEADASTLPALAPTRGTILISLDTLRADHLGLYGYPLDTSPFLDRLAERSLVFDNAVVQYPSTLTSHMSMLTGLYPGEHGVYPPDATLSPEIPLLQEAFQSAGHRTAGFTEGGYVRGRYGFRRGFDVFKARDRRGGEQTRATFARGVRFLQSLEDDQPFFLFLHTYAVHAPYQPEESYRKQFWPGPAPQAAFPPTGPELRRHNQENATLDDETRRYFIALYDAEIRQLDAALEELFSQLDGFGLLAETIIVITSDHGEEFEEHGRVNHEQLYQEILHVPLLIYHPQLDRSHRRPELAQSIDLMPTVLALQRLQPGLPVSGRDLLATTPEAAAGEWAYAEARPHDRAAYHWHDEGLYHLLSFGDTRPRELYRVDLDPSETMDFAATETEVFQTMVDFLAAIDHQPRAAAGSLHVTPDEQESLRALGYVD
jgi:arylsulfatase A-like enzyme